MAASVPGAAQDDTPPAVAFETDTLAIETGDGRRHVFTVELALTPEQQARGLMFREELADDRGMLFLYRGDSIRRMWMRNTLIPLDMLFIAGDGTIVSIVRETEPLSLETISSRVPARAVLELRGGLTVELGITRGDRVIHPWLRAR